MRNTETPSRKTNWSISPQGWRSGGFDVEFLGDFSLLEDPALGQGQGQPRLPRLAEKLRRADSFAVILPQVAYTETEAALVERFVQNDANFRRILIRDFQPDQLTAGLETITLDSAGTIQSPGGGLAFAGPGTKSSVLNTVGSLSPIAWGDSRNVLAIADFTFMVPVNDSLLDNGRLVSNIADYVTDSVREFHLSDFPYFYETGQNEGVDILIGQPSLLNTGLQMKNSLAPYWLSSRVGSVEDVSRDSVFLGLFEDAPQVSQYLQVAGVRVDDTLGTAFAPELELDSTAVIVLDRSQSRDMLAILADTPQTLNGAVTRLFSGEFRRDLVSDFVAISKFEGMGQ